MLRSIPSILDSSTPALSLLSRWRPSSHQSIKIVKIISILLVTLYICVSTDGDGGRKLGSTSNGSGSYTSTLSRDGQIRQDTQIFQITLTGVPNRLPTVLESMFFESTLIDSLKEALVPRQIRLNKVRVKSDKTIHYQRTLDERFNVAGMSFTSQRSAPAPIRLITNGESEIDVEIETETETEFENDLYMQVMDEETLTRINETNRRILAMDKSNADDTTSMYQLSLLLEIQGTYRTSSALDYSSTVWSAINQNQMSIVESLVNPPPEAHGAEYFGHVHFMVCVGVGYRDADDPVLEMVNSSNNKKASPTTTSSTTNTDSRGSTDTASSSSSSSSSSSEDVGESRSKYNPQEQNEYGSSSQGMTSTDSAVVNLETSSDSYSTPGASGNEHTPSAYERGNDLLNEDSISSSVFNPQASRFQLVSGIVFLVLCCVALLSNLVRVAAKKATDRKKRLAIAKEAYEGPSQEALRGHKTFFNRSSKYTGTMDTGAGLQ